MINKCDVKDGRRSARTHSLTGAASRSCHVCDPPVRSARSEAIKSIPNKDATSRHKPQSALIAPLMCTTVNCGVFEYYSEY